MLETYDKNNKTYKLTQTNSIFTSLKGSTRANTFFEVPNSVWLNHNFEAMGDSPACPTLRLAVITYELHTAGVI
jgi:hypothetical protein